MEWFSIKDKLPEVNVLVKVRLTNETEAIDFVNEPIDERIPFQHYLVKEWRYLTLEELRSVVQTLVHSK